MIYILVLTHHNTYNIHIIAVHNQWSMDEKDIQKNTIIINNTD